MTRLAACFALLLLLALPATAQITLDADDLYVSEPVTVRLATPSEALTVTYRPGSSIETTETLPLRGGQSVTWTPAQAGVVALSAGGSGLRNVSVRYQRAPTGGIIVLLIAGCLLFGGAIFAFRKLFQDGPRPAKPSLRPDT